MKKIILAVCIMSFSVALAQRPERRTQEHESFSLEQKAQLKTKKMVLLLDLSDKQSRDILALNENWMRKKTSQKEAYKAESEDRKMSKDEQFDRLMAHLDEKIEYNQQLSRILTSEQYELWKTKEADRGNCRRFAKRKGRSEGRKS